MKITNLFMAIALLSAFQLGTVEQAEARDAQGAHITNTNDPDPTAPRKNRRMMRRRSTIPSPTLTGEIPTPTNQQQSNGTSIRECQQELAQVRAELARLRPEAERQLEQLNRFGRALAMTKRNAPMGGDRNQAWELEGPRRMLSDYNEIMTRIRNLQQRERTLSNRCR